MLRKYRLLTYELNLSVRVTYLSISLLCATVQLKTMDDFVLRNPEFPGTCIYGWKALDATIPNSLRNNVYQRVKSWCAKNQFKLHT